MSVRVGDCLIISEGWVWSREKTMKLYTIDDLTPVRYATQRPTVHVDAICGYFVPSLVIVLLS